MIFFVFPMFLFKLTSTVYTFDVSRLNEDCNYTTVYASKYFCVTKRMCAFVDAKFCTKIMKLYNEIKMQKITNNSRTFLSCSLKISQKNLFAKLKVVYLVEDLTLGISNDCITLVKRVYLVGDRLPWVWRQQSGGPSCRYCRNIPPWVESASAQGYPA